MSYYQSKRKKGRIDRFSYSINIFSLTKVLILIASMGAIDSIASPSMAQPSTGVERSSRQQTTTKLEIDNITHDGVDRALSPGEVLTITMKGTSGVQASFLLIGDKQTIREIRAKEIAPGTYQGRIIVSVRDRLVEGAIMGRLQQGRRVTYSAASNAFTYSRDRANNTNQIPPSTSFNSPTESAPNPSVTAINQDLRPQFTSHRNGEEIDTNGFILQGQTQAHAQVKITIMSQFPIFGNIVQIEGNKLIEQTVRANSEGVFQLPIPPVPVSSTPSGLKYLINAVASLNNQTSPSTELTLVQP